MSERSKSRPMSCGRSLFLRVGEVCFSGFVPVVVRASLLPRYPWGPTVTLRDVRPRGGILRNAWTHQITMKELRSREMTSQQGISCNAPLAACHLRA